LYIGKTRHGYAVASELKAVLACPNVARSIDVTAIAQYLSFDYIIGPRTPFLDVMKLPGGHFATITRSGVELTRYWQPDFDGERRRDSGILESLDTALRESVRRRLAADVPVGLFLSGGLDSTTVGYYMRLFS